ncbi:hypothetical protein ACMGE7_01905 [Macrococcus equi]|uniref:hypothetical protein n=1 Tax=Macrococcus equi TaxID=3395462 RepID=UPI0039BE8EA0
MGKRLKFEERFIQSKEEMKSYNEKNYTFEEISNILKKCICEFIYVTNNNKIFPSNEVYIYNLAELYQFPHNNYKNKHINKFLTETLLLNYHPFEVLSNDSLHYIYVVQRYDGMVCVVGRSQFHINAKFNEKVETDEDNNFISAKIEVEVFKYKFGDLFQTIVPSSSSGLQGTQKLIYELLLQSGKDFESITEEMKNYYSQAIVIPVQGGKSMADAMESLLGEYLRDKDINILNCDSHLW